MMSLFIFLQAFNVWEILVFFGRHLETYLNIYPDIVRGLFVFASFLVTFIGFNVFTALVIFTFKAKFRRCQSLATIHQMTNMLNYEKMLDTDDMDNLRKEYYRNFNPLVSSNFVLYMESYTFHLKLNTIKNW